MFKDVYLYVSLANDLATIQKSIDNAKTQIILDLEDTVIDKKQALLNLGALNGNRKTNIHLRIHDDSVLDDLNMDPLNIQYIFVPKVTTSTRMKNLKEKYPHLKFITMIESNVKDDIIHQSLNYSEGVHFGYYDFCLSENIFPIKFDGKFLSIQNHLSNIVLSHRSKIFIMSPMKSYSSGILKENTYQCITRFNQLEKLHPDYFYALDIIKKYENGNKVGNFVKCDDSYISPHEYKLAKQYIKKLDE